MQIGMWRLVKAVGGLLARSSIFPYERLMNRAIEQRGRAEALRLQSAITAFRPT